MFRDNIDVIKNTAEDAGSYLLSSTLSRIFLATVCFIALINIAKSMLIRRERKHDTPSRPCKHLVYTQSGQDCSIPSRKQGFRNRGFSCDGCVGRTSYLTVQEAEERASSAAAWKRWLLGLATCGKTALPYISFIYTLLIVIFEL